MKLAGLPWDEGEPQAPHPNTAHTPSWQATFFFPGILCSAQGSRSYSGPGQMNPGSPGNYSR